MASNTRRATPAPQKRLRSLNAAAEYLAVTPRTVRVYIADGRLTGYRVGTKHVRVDMNEVENLITVIPTGTEG